MDYSGTFQYNIDPKGRIAVPPRYREQFSGAGCRLSLRTDHIALFDPDGWARYKVRLTELFDAGRITRRTLNDVLAASPEIRTDAQGRFNLGGLAEVAGLTERVIVVGLDTYFGIYRPELAPGQADGSLPASLALLDELPL